MPDPVPEGRCRACRAPRGEGDLVLDLGAVPAADAFPAPGDPLPDPVHPLSMWLCPVCGLAQLTADDTTSEEPRAVEPQALRDQAADAVTRVHAWEGLPRAARVREFGSPHGGSWLPLFAERGWQETQNPAEVVVDTFGLMHEPDLRAAIRERADALAEDGVLLLLFHSLTAIVEHRQWSSLRHGHFGYFTGTSLTPLLAQAGLSPVAVWHFALYGGTVLLAARRTGTAEASVGELLAAEQAARVTDPSVVGGLQHAADTESRALTAALADAPEQGPWYAYGAASRAVAVLHLAGVTTDRLAAVADASPGKQGRAMPGTRIPIISPTELVDADPQRVWLLLPDLLREVSAALPELDGRWRAP